jgi:hypothetical protein
MMRHAWLAILLVAVPAGASSPQAWDAGNATAARACRAAAGLKDARISGGPIIFSDTQGKTALLVTGRWRPAHMKGAPATMLCLYDRRRHTAETQEASGWASPPA